MFCSDVDIPISAAGEALEQQAAHTGRSAQSSGFARRRCPQRMNLSDRHSSPPQVQKRKILHDVIANINMKHGDGALMSLGDKPLAV